MESSKNRYLLFCAVGIALLAIAAPIWAKYKAKPWTVSARESYPAFLTSEGVTIAAEPLFTDALASRVFDKTDIVTRGIMPLGIIIFNDNDFPIEVDGLSIEVIHDSDHLRTLSPNEVVYRLFRKDRSWLPRVSPVPRSDLNEEALDDFDSKFLMEKLVEPHSKEGGFIFLHIRDSEDLASYLAKSVVYIPNVYRRDNGSRMIFFEIGLGQAIPPGSKD